MSLVGALETMPLEELFQWIAHSQKTGTVVVEKGRVEKRVFVRDGKIISSSSSMPSEWLGHFLVAHGHLTEAELAQAMEVQGSGQTLLGKILVTLNVLTEEDLEEMIRLKAEESIFDLFTWQEGQFRFDDGSLPEWKMIPISLDLSGLVMRGAQRVDETREMRRTIPDNTVVPVVIKEVQLSELDGRESRILEHVDDLRSIEEIALETHTTEFQVSRVIASQVEAGTMKVIRSVREPPGAAPSPPPEPAGAPGTGVAAEPGSEPPRESASTSGATSTPERLSPLSGAIDQDSPLAQAQRALRAGDLSTALAELEAIRGTAIDSPDSREGLAELERRIRAEVAAIGIVPEATPQRARSAEALTRATLNSKEMFLLSRIDGEYDVRTIVKICPVPPLETLVLLRNLVLRGHIQVEPTPVQS